MVLFFVERMTLAEATQYAEKAIEVIDGWFGAHPRKRVCRTELWYGRVYKIARGDTDAIRRQVYGLLDNLKIDGKFEP